MFSVGMSEATALSDHQTLRGTKRQLQSAMATQVPRNQPQAMELCYDSEFIPFQLQIVLTGHSDITSYTDMNIDFTLNSLYDENE